MCWKMEKKKNPTKQNKRRNNSHQLIEDCNFLLCFVFCAQPELPQVHLCELGNSWGNHHSGQPHSAKYFVSARCSAGPCPRITTFCAQYESKTKLGERLLRFINFRGGCTLVIIPKVKSTFFTIKSGPSGNVYEIVTLSYSLHCYKKLSNYCGISMNL